MLFCFPVLLWQEALFVDRRDASRRVSLLRSQIIIFKQNLTKWLFLRILDIPFKMQDCSYNHDIFHNISLSVQVFMHLYFFQMFYVFCSLAETKLLIAEVCFEVFK